MKKLISLLMAVFLILSVVPMTFSASTDIKIDVVNEIPVDAYCALSGGNSLPQEGGATIWRPGDRLTYNLNVPKDGKYRMMFLIGGTIGGTFATDVYLDDELIYQGNGTIIGDYGDRKNTLLDADKGSDIELTAGSKKLTIEHTGGGGHYFEAIWFFDLGDPITIKDVKSGENSIIETELSGRNTETIEVIFSKAVNPDCVDDVNLFTEDGESVACAKEFDVDRVIFTLYKSLDYGKEYVVRIGEISDSFDYSKTESCDIVFSVGVENLDDAKAQELISAFNSCESSEDFETYFTDNAEFLEINPTKDLKGLKKDKFYPHFVGVTVEDFNEIKNNYDFFVAAETINQATLPNLSNFLSKEKNCLLLGFEKGLFDAANNRKSTIIRNIMTARPFDDTKGLSKKVIEIIYDNLKIEYNKSDLSLAIDDITLKAGQGFSVPLEFADEFSELKGIKFEIESSDIDLKRAEFPEEMQNSSFDEQQEDYLSGSIMFNEIISDKTNVEIKLIAPNSAVSADVTIKGKAVFDVGIGYDLETDILENTFAVEVKKQSSSGGSGSGGGRGSSRPSAGGLVSIPSNKEEKPAEKFVFKDAGEVEWAEESIIYLTDSGVLEETADGLFHPSKDITRDEFVKILVKALGILDEKAECTLNDINKSNENYKYIASAQKHGIVLGNDEGNFMTGQNITREDICVIIHRALKGVYSFADVEKILFADDDEIAEYAKEAVYDVRFAGIIEGVGDNTFAPKATLNKAMAAKMVFSIMNRISKK